VLSCGAELYKGRTAAGATACPEPSPGPVRTGAAEATAVLPWRSSRQPTSPSTSTDQAQFPSATSLTKT